MRSVYLLLVSIGLLALLLAGCGNTAQEGKNGSVTKPTENSSQSEAKDNVKPDQTKKSFYYTADEGGSISIVDAQTNSVIDTLPVEGVAHNVQISPDGKILGVAVIPGKMEGMENEDNQTSDSNSHGNMNMNGSGDDGQEKQEEHGGDAPEGLAYFYETDTNKLLKKVEVGGHPAHIVFSHDGKYAIVTNGEDDSVSVIDTKTFETIKTISTGDSPHGFRISADSKYVYVANMGEDTVSVLDLVGMKELKKIKVGKNPVTTAVTSDGKTFMATLNGENALAIVDVETGDVQKVPVGNGPAQVYLQPDGQFAFVANQGTEEKPEQTVSKIDMKTREVVATITVGKGAHGIVVDPDNKFVYVTNMYENTVSVIDNSTNKTIATVPVGNTPNGITFKK